MDIVLLAPMAIDVAALKELLAEDGHRVEFANEPVALDVLRTALASGGTPRIEEAA